MKALPSDNPLVPMTMEAGFNESMSKIQALLGESNDILAQARVVLTEQIMTLALRLPMEKVEDERKLLGPILADVIKNRDGQGNPASDDPSEKHCCLKLLHDEANKISA